MSTWVALGFDEPGSATNTALVEGIPPWIETSYWLWIQNRFILTVSRGSGTWERFDNGLLRAFELATRTPVPYAGNDPGDGMAALRYAVTIDEARLRLLDFLLAHRANKAQADGIDAILETGGSAWRVGERYGKPGLVRRVPEGVELVAKQAMDVSSHAGRLLADAWSAAFGIDPDPSKAYGLAVKAIEAAAGPVLSPNDASATLGKMNGVLRDQPGWTLPFDRIHEHAAPGTVLRGIQQMLWTGQTDRHGSADPLPITQPAAETAVVFAAILVHAYTAGLITRGSYTRDRRAIPKRSG